MNMFVFRTMASTSTTKNSRLVQLPTNSDQLTTGSDQLLTDLLADSSNSRDSQSLPDSDDLLDIFIGGGAGNSTTTSTTTPTNISTLFSPAVSRSASNRTAAAAQSSQTCCHPADFLLSHEVGASQAADLLAGSTLGHGPFLGHCPFLRLLPREFGHYFLLTKLHLDPPGSELVVI